MRRDPGGILCRMMADSGEHGETRGAPSASVDPQRALALARDVLDTEARAISSLTPPSS